jgi:uncharacterized membrane protein
MNSQAQAPWPRPDVRVARTVRSSRRLAIAAIVGLIAVVLTGLFWRWIYAPAMGWDATAIVFSTWIWLVIWPMGAADTAAKARSVDPNRATSDILTLSAAVASIAAVGIVLVGASSARGLTADMLAAFGLISIAISWFTVHTIFTLRYALLYYEGAEGGVSFNQDEPPSYRDFAYLALTIGMTFQVSDTDLQTTAIRSAALRHALLSYLFGTVILAATINLIAGLGSARGV